jgi:type II secretory pathway component GspD/PulD (secretin)
MFSVRWFVRIMVLASIPLVVVPGGPARAESRDRPEPLDAPTASGLRTEVIFLRDNGMGAERALALYERVIGQSGESSAMVGRQPNMLVVRDTPERLARFRRLLDALDRGGAERRLYVRPVAHLAPSELAPADVRLVPDDRSSALIVSATLADYRRLDALIRRIDVPAEGRDTRQIRVTPGPSEGGFPP